MKTALNILKSMRPVEALLKNGFVVAALAFGFPFIKKADRPDALLRIAFAYVIFWLVSCCVYIINDVLDRASDREHPTKRRRPIANGSLRVRTALFFVVVALGASFGASGALMPQFALVVAVYFALQIAYSLYLKQLVLIDAMAVALGFLLRVVGGGVAIDVEILPWLLVTTLLLALLLAFAKRRHELTLLGDNAKNHRGVLSDYSPYFLDQIIAVVTAATLITYCLYTLEPGTVAKFGTRLPYTIPFVFYGIFRYLYLVHHKKGGGHVGRTLLTDLPLLVDIFLWGVSILLILYWPM
jgi:4-hydroxybenzoate polyprenyltransferase